MSVDDVQQWDQQLGCYVLEKHQDERRMGYVAAGLYGYHVHCM